MITEHGNTEEAPEGRVASLYWSPTGTTRRVATRLASTLALHAGLHRAADVDCTGTAAGLHRAEAAPFDAHDVVVVAVPVYAGRVPNVLLSYLRSLQGHGAIAVAVVVYGNRHYDDALVELVDLLNGACFNVVAGATFIGEHSFSKVLAAGRPDEADLVLADEYAMAIAKTISKTNSRHAANDTGQGCAIKGSLPIPGSRPYRPYYKPISASGEEVDIRKLVPETTPDCIHCGLCARICPMGSIDPSEPSVMRGICIKCGACVKRCPLGAKTFTDGAYLRHLYELERDCVARKEPELFM